MSDEENELAFAGAIQMATALDKINSGIIFGESGVGKTILAASAVEIEDYAPVLILDVEGSSAGVGRIHPDVHVLPIASHAQFEAALDELLTKKHPYKTVIVDTFNVAQNRAEKHFRAKPENANNKFGVWADLKDWSIGTARKLHHAPFTAWLICHTDQVKDENTGALTTTVKLAGSSKQDLPAVHDFIGYMENDTNEAGDTIAVLRVGRQKGIITKNRFGLDGTIYPKDGAEYPTMIDIQFAITKAQVEREDTE